MRRALRATRRFRTSGGVTLIELARHDRDRRRHPERDHPLGGHGLREHRDVGTADVDRSNLAEFAARYFTADAVSSARGPDRRDRVPRRRHAPSRSCENDGTIVSYAAVTAGGQTTLVRRTCGAARPQRSRRSARAGCPSTPPAPVRAARHRRPEGLLHAHRDLARRQRRRLHAQRHPSLVVTRQLRHCSRRRYRFQVIRPIYAQSFRVRNLR